MKVTRQQFEAWVREALAEIPPYFRRRLENVDVTVEDKPTDEVLRDLGLGPGDSLYGLYQGVPRLHRGAGYGNVLPDKITIYSRPLLRSFTDRHDLQRAIRETVWHEVGHYFGLSEEELMRLEDGDWEEEGP